MCKKDKLVSNRENFMIFSVLKISLMVSRYYCLHLALKLLRLYNRSFIYYKDLGNLKTLYFVLHLQSEMLTMFIG